MSGDARKRVPPSVALAEEAYQGIADLFLEGAALSMPKDLGRESACPCKRRSQARHRFPENAEKILCCLVASFQHLVVA
jgi:hypothetical protein